MTKLLKLGCLFVTSHALIISNDSSQDVFLKTSHICQEIHQQPSIKIPANNKNYLTPDPNYLTLCVMTQATLGNEEEVHLIRILNTLNAQLRIIEQNGKLSIQTAFC